jgi:hypothetical protein
MYCKRIFLHTAHLELARTKNDPLFCASLRFFGSLLQGNDATCDKPYVVQSDDLIKADRWAQNFQTAN